MALKPVLRSHKWFSCRPNPTPSVCVPRYDFTKKSPRVCGYCKVGLMWAHWIWALSSVRYAAWLVFLMLCPPSLTLKPTGVSGFCLKTPCRFSSDLLKVLKRHDVGSGMREINSLSLSLSLSSPPSASPSYNFQNSSNLKLLIQRLEDILFRSSFQRHGSIRFNALRRSGDEITTISHRSETVDPVLENLKSLKLSTPILKSPPTESSLTDILVRKALSNSSSNTVDPQVLLELFSIYQEWQESKAREISKRQEDVENKIEVADALAIKLLQRFNHSVSAMRTTSQHLSQVHALQVELGELKGRLTEVISNCDALCKRISSEGPESLRATVKPLTFASPTRSV